MRPIKNHCVKCNTFRKCINPIIFHIFDKTLVLSISCGKCDVNNDITFKKEESIKILKILVLIEQNFREYLINMPDKPISQEFRCHW